MTVSLLKRLLRAGIGVRAAIKMINLLLLSKSSDEVFATIDLMCLNLFSGRMDIIKLGAARSFVRNGGVVKTVEGCSMPVGICSGADFDCRTLHLSDGDCAVMFSDGIGESAFPRVRELMLSDGVSIQRCADMILECGSDENGASPQTEDDKTVFVVKLHKI